MVERLRARGYDLTCHVVGSAPTAYREYVRRARRIAERHRLRLPREFAHAICRSCDAFLVPGRNARVRTQSGHVVVTCDCGVQSRYPYS